MREHEEAEGDSDGGLDPGKIAATDGMGDTAGSSFSIYGFHRARKVARRAVEREMKVRRYSNSTIEVMATPLLLPILIE